MENKTIVVETYGPDFSNLSEEDFDLAFQIYETAGRQIQLGFDKCQVARIAFDEWREEGFTIFDPNDVESILTCEE